MRPLWWGAEDTDDDDDSQEPVVEKPSTQNLTADELEKIAARAADRAGRKASKDLASEFGFSNVNDFKVWVQSQKQAEKDSLDENERARQEAEQAKKDYESQRADLVSDRLDVAIERHVLAAGVTDAKKVSRIAALVRMDLSEDILDTEDSWGDSITDALSSVQDDTPELFSAPAGSGHGSGDGGARGRSTEDKDEAAERDKKLRDEFATRGLIQYPG